MNWKIEEKLKYFRQSANKSSLLSYFLLLNKYNNGQGIIQSQEIF